MAPELRRDPVSGGYVLISAERSGRPRSVSGRLASDDRGARAQLRGHDDSCPFCTGNEHMTLPEICRTGPGGSGDPGWRVRVFPNRYPVVDASGGAGATGVCEVVVFSPAHDRGLGELEQWHVAEVLTVLRDRVRDQRAAGRVSAQVFVNQGSGSGASLEHPHAQLIGLDFIPPAVQLELDMVAALGEDPLARDLLEAERHDTVVVDGPLVAWCPSATPEPSVVRIAPRVAGRQFADADADTIESSARTLRQVLRAVCAAHGDPPYNVIVFVDADRSDGAQRRWRIEVVPRLFAGGGFERGSGMSTNAVDPRVAAHLLRAHHGE